MTSRILKETYDDNLKSTIRLRLLEHGRVVFTTTGNTMEVNNIKNLCKPILAQIRVTKDCNLNCPYCYAENSLSNQDMSYEQMIQVLDLCNKQGVLAITWTGGEPLTKSFFPQLVRQTHLLGIRQTVLTNGTLSDIILDENFPKDNINFQVSLNNIWDDISGNEPVIENAKRLLRAGYEVMLSIMLETVPIKRYEALIQKMISSNISIAKFGLKLPIGAANQDDMERYEREIKLLIPDLFELKRKYEKQITIIYQFDMRKYQFTGFPRRLLMCEAGTTQIYIDNNGDVYPCPLLKSYPFMKCGNVFKNGWMELWNAPPMEFLRNISECSNCEYNCKVWCRALKFATDNSFLGRSYFCLKSITN